MAASSAQTRLAPIAVLVETKRTRFVSSAGRSPGRWAVKIVVASLTPSRATRASRIAATVMKAIVPRPDGPSARVTTTSATKSPEFPASWAQKSSAEPRAAGSRSRACERERSRDRGGPSEAAPFRRP